MSAYRPNTDITILLGKQKVSAITELYLMVCLI
jgi:hypothetical protein